MAAHERARQVAEHLKFRHLDTTAPSTTANVLVKTVEVLPGHKVATVTICNPSKSNTINTQLLIQLIEAFQKLAVDGTLRAIVLTGGATAPGKRPAFIGGADIREMSDFSNPEQARAFITTVHRLNKAIRDAPAPVIARVHGVSLGGGLEIMISCDLRIATKASTFGMPEVRVGIPSVIEAALLPGLIGMGRTRRMLYLAENIGAVTAERWGLIEQVVEDEDELDLVLKSWIDMIVSMGPKTMKSQKRLMQMWENVPVDQAIMAGVEAYAGLFADGGKEPKAYMDKYLRRSN